MYPNLYYAFKDIFGVELSGLRFVNSFGFFVALAFLAGAYILTLEMKRKERAGLMHAKEEKIRVGEGAQPGDLLLNFFLGFVLGYKLVGLFLMGKDEQFDPQAFIFSARGNLTAGLLLGLFFAGVKYWEKHKQKLPTPEDRVIRIWPHDRVGDIVVFAAIFGFLGAKIFHNLENWNDFIRNPIEALLSFSGLTFYGGLICAALAIFFYARKNRIGFRHLCDTMAPTLMLAYAIGRIGCQVSGDGDWGIMNSAYVSTPEGTVVRADTNAFHRQLDANAGFYQQAFRGTPLSALHHTNVIAPSFLPRWLVAYNFSHNVINEGVPIAGCEGQYCSQLPVPVFPTAFYETLAGLALFGFLWAIRKKIKIPGVLFSVYLMVNGLERFFIEKIRVNNKYSILGFHPTQAEIISFALFLTGLILFIYLRRRAAGQSSVTV
jgi:phosphatidylglycerol:prolipoprotein diacylglycerol transferase